MSKTAAKNEFGLTIKEQRFCEHYLKSGNGTQSFIDAGYSYSTRATAGNCAYNFLRKPHIKKYIDHLNAEIKTSIIADAEEILAYLTRVVRGEEHEEGEFSTPARITDRNKAAELLGKRYGTWRTQMDSEEQRARIDKTHKDMEVTSTTEEKIEVFLNTLGGILDDTAEDDNTTAETIHEETDRDISED